MALFEEISSRKSTRKYDMTPLAAEVLEEIKAFAENAMPLLPGIRVEYHIIGANKTKGFFAVKAPHYLVISSESKAGYLTNAGFMFQQVCLYLSSKGFGSCWVGGVKPAEKVSTDLEHVMVMAFGNAAEDIHRAMGEFKRKPLQEIATGADDRLEYARLAPSAINSQPWFFVCENGGIDVYRKKNGALKAIVYEKMSEVDIGIALCHIWLASEHLGVNFSFEIEKTPATAPPKGYLYIGTVKP